MSANDEKAKIRFAKDILKHNNTLIRLIDTKARMVLGSAGIILGLLSFLDHDMVVGHAVYVLYVTAGLLVTTVILSFLVIYPRTTSTAKGETAIFYRSIIQQTRKEYHSMLEGITPDGILADYTRNIYSLALVQKNKFRFLKASLISMVLSIVFLAVTLGMYLAL